MFGKLYGEAVEGAFVKPCDETFDNLSCEKVERAVVLKFGEDGCRSAHDRC